MRLPITPGAILCYHGVFGPQAPAAPFHVHASQLDRDIRLLRRMGEVVPLAHIIERLAAGKPTRGLFALTFDDAYAGVLQHGLPVLEVHAAPASVFAVSGVISAGGQFWWDRLADLETRFPAATWADLVVQHRLDRPAILRAGQGRLTSAQEEVLAALEERTGFATRERSVNAAELSQLEAHPLLRIGPHSVSHAAFEFLDEATERRELSGCILALEALGCELLPVFAAPFGLGTGRTLALAREAGLDATLGVSPRTLRGAKLDGPLPRFVMSRTRTGARLARQLAGLDDVIKDALGRREPDWASAG